MVDIYGAIGCAATLYFARPDALKVGEILTVGGCEGGGGGGRVGMRH